MVVKLELERELERRFRELAMKRFGYSRGAIKKAAESAIKKWAEEETTKPMKRRGESCVDLLVGGLAHLRGEKTSVELQHETKKIWSKIAEDK